MTTLTFSALGRRYGMTEEGSMMLGGEHNIELTSIAGQCMLYGELPGCPVTR